MASADLYALLGVARDATKAQIRAAYRKAAKMAHPDQPSGSAEKFGALKHAHDILTDDGRRKNYDDTGDASEVKPNNRQAEIRNAIAQYLAEAMSRPDAETVDLVKVMTQRINGQIMDHMQNLSTMEDQKKHLQKMRKRFKAKKGKQDVLGMMVDQMIAGADMKIEMTKNNIESLKEIGELIQNHTFTADPPMPGIAIRKFNIFGNTRNGF